MRYFLLILLLLSTVSVGAIYVEKENNTTVYTDTPSPAGKATLVTPANTMSSPVLNAPPVVPKSTTQTVTTASTAPVPTKGYKVFTITSPKDQETIPNQPTFPVEIAIDPPLQPNDKVQLFIDNAPWGAPSETPRFEVANLARGAHQMFAVIMDANKNTLMQSNNVNINIYRTSLLNPNGFPKQ